MHVCSSMQDKYAQFDEIESWRGIFFFEMKKVSAQLVFYILCMFRVRLFIQRKQKVI